MSRRKQRDGRFKARMALELSRMSKLSVRLPVNTVSIRHKLVKGKNKFLRNYLNFLRNDVQKRLPTTS